MLARKVDESGKKDNSNPVPWRFVPDERKLTNTKVHYTQMMLERVAQLYERYQADYKLESEIEAEEQDKEFELVDELRRTGAGTGELYTSGEQSGSTESLRTNPPTNIQLSDPKRRQTLINKLTSLVSDKIQKNQRSLRDYGGLRGVHFNREEAFFQYHTQQKQQQQKRGREQREPSLMQSGAENQATASRRSSMESGSSVESGQALDSVVENLKRDVVQGNIEQVLQVLRKYPAINEMLPTHEEFPVVTSLPHGFGDLMDALYEASLLGQDKNSTLIKQLQTFHNTLEQAAADEGVTGKISEDERQLALTQARKRLQREVNEMIDAHHQGEPIVPGTTKRSSRRPALLDRKQ